MIWLKQIRPIHIIILSVIVYAIFIAISDFQDSLSILLHFPILLFAVMLICALINYLIRFVKWHYYLKIIDVKIPVKKSLLIFLAGFSMTITPGKSGELIKSHLLCKDGYPISHTSPVVFAERLTDLFGMIILALIGGIAFGFSPLPLLILLVLLGIVVIIVQYEPLALRTLILLNKLPMISKHNEKIERLYFSSRVLTHGKPLSFGIVLSVISWLFECICLYIALLGIGMPVPILTAVFIFAFSTIAGIIAMLPGGLGATEAVMMALLAKTGVPLADATAATLLARLATLWFAVGIGMVVLAYLEKQGSEKKVEDTNS